MAIQVGGTTVINDSRALQNIASVDSTTKSAIESAGVGGGLTMLQDSTISSTTAYIQYTFPSGYEIFHFVFRKFHTDDTNTDRNLSFRFTDSSNNLITGSSRYVNVSSDSGGAFGHSAASDFYTMGAANKSYAPTGFVTVYSPKDSSCQTLVITGNVGVYSYNSSDFQSYTNRGHRFASYEIEAHNAIRFYPEGGGNIHSSSSSYQVWGKKNA